MFLNSIIMKIAKILLITLLTIVVSCKNKEENKSEKKSSDSATVFEFGVWTTANAKKSNEDYAKEFEKYKNAGIDEVLINTIGVKELVVGYDYAFGKGRQGNIEFLKEQGRLKGFPVTVVEPYYVDDMLVSSSKIRGLVSEGRMMDVKKLLGRSYQIRGTVQEGKKRGGPVVGFKTANLHLSEEDLCPKHGVYVTQVVYEGKCYGGVLNIGYNPTFGENRLSAETHIFDFNQEIYGREIKINLLKHLRGEKKFSGPEELAGQIREDILLAKEILDEAQKDLLLSCEEKYNR